MNRQQIQQKQPLLQAYNVFHLQLHSTYIPVTVNILHIIFFYGSKKEISKKEKISRQKKDACSSKKNCPQI